MRSLKAKRQYKNLEGHRMDHREEMEKENSLIWNEQQGLVLTEFPFPGSK